MPSKREIAVDPLLLSDETQLVELPDLRGRRTEERDVFERVASPECESLAKKRAGRFYVACPPRRRASASSLSKHAESSSLGATSMT